MSFNWYDVIEKIISDLEKSGYTNYTTEIIDRVRSGAMFGEIISGVCSKLLDIKISDSDAYNLIKEDSERLIEFCKSNGIIPYPSNLSKNDLL